MKFYLYILLVLFGQPGLFNDHLSAHPGSGIVVDRQGQVFFTDTGIGIWKIETNGLLSRSPGSAFHWMAVDDEGHFAQAPSKFDGFERITPAGSKPTLMLCSESPFVFGRDGNLYYADTRPPTRIIRRTPAGKESILAGGSPLKPGGQSESPTFQGVSGMALAPDGSIFLAENSHDSDAHAVRKISPDGKVSIFATGFLTEGSQPTPKATPVRCRGLAVDKSGNVLLADTDRRRLVRVTSSGKTSTVLQASAPWSPTGVTVFRDEIYVLEYTDFPPGWNQEDRKGWIPRVRKVARDGTVVTVATVSRDPAKSESK